MKLVKCTPYAIKAPDWHYGHGGTIFTFVKLETDNGLVGWGECAAQDAFQNNPYPYISTMNGLFEKYIKGEDALAREKILKKLYARFTVSHCDMIASSMFSAFDIALWDIAGKAFGQPVYQLLGGKYRDKIRSYTYVYTDPEMPNSKGWMTPKVAAAHAKKFVDMGYTAVKLDPIPQVDRLGYPAGPWDMSLEMYYRAEDTIGAVREAVGRDIDILIGTHGQISPAWSVKLGRMLEQFNVAWFEEPTGPENPKDCAIVARAVNIPVATGERLCFSYEFQHLFEKRACAIAQPDLGTVGGFTEFKKIAGMAEANYIQMAPHVWGGPIITAAAIQCDTYLPNFMIQENIDEGSKGFFGELVDEPFEWKDGYFSTLERPGIGINLNEDALEKYGVK